MWLVSQAFGYKPKQIEQIGQTEILTWWWHKMESQSDYD